MRQAHAPRRIIRAAALACLPLTLLLSAPPAALARRQDAPDLVMRADIHGEALSSFVLPSPDGKRWVRIRPLAGTVTVYDGPAGLPLNTFGTGQTGMSARAAFTADGSRLAVSFGSGFDRYAQLFDVQTGVQLADFRRGSNLFDTEWASLDAPPLTITPEGRWLVTGGGKIRIWDMRTGKLSRRFDAPGGGAAALAAAPDGKTLAAAGADGVVRLWSLETQQELKRLGAPEQAVSQLVFGRDGNRLTGFNAKREVVSWDVASGKESGRFVVASSNVLLGGDGETVTVYGPEQAEVWDVSARKMKEARKYTAATGSAETTRIAQATFTPSAGGAAPGLLLTGSYGSATKVFPLAGDAEVFQYPEHFEAAAYSPDGATLATNAGYGGKIELRDARTGAVARTLQNPERVGTFAFSPDGKLLAVGGSGKTVTLWDLGAGAVARTLPAAAKGATSLAFSADGRLLVVSDGEKSSVREVEGGAEVLKTEGVAALSGDGKLLAANDRLSDGGYYVTVFDLVNRTRVRELHPLRPFSTGPDFGPSVLAFAPDRRTLAAGGSKGRITLWDVSSGEPLFQLPGHRDAVASLNFDADGRTLVSISNDEAALWSMTARRKLANLYLVGRHDWLVVTPDARFDGTAGARKLLHWVEGATPAPLEKYEANFATPRLLARVLSEQGTPAAAVRFRNEVRTPPAVALRPAAAPRYAGGELEVEVEVRERGGGLGELQLRQNGKVVALEQSQNLRRGPGGALTHGYKLRLAPGANRLQALAFSTDGVAGEAAEASVEAAEPPPAASAQILLPLGHRGNVLALAACADGRTLASAGEDGTVKLWDITNGRTLLSLAGGGATFTALRFSPDGLRLAAGGAYPNQSATAETVVWDVATGLPVVTFVEQRGGGSGDFGVADVRYSRDGRLLATVTGRVSAGYRGVTGGGNKIVVRELAGGKQVRVFRAESEFHGVAFGADGATLLAGDGDAVSIFDLATGKTLRKLEGHKKVTAAVLSPDGTRVATAAADGTVRVWDFASGRNVASFGAGAKGVTGLDFSGDGKNLLVVGGDGVVQLRAAAAPGGADRSAAPPDGRTHAACFVGEQFFATAHDAGLIRISDVADAAERRALRPQTDPVKHIFYVAESERNTWSDARGRLVTLTERGSFLWDLGRLRLDGAVASNLYKLQQIGPGWAATPDLSLLVIGDQATKTIGFLDVASKQQKELKDLPIGSGEYSWLSKIAVSADGRFIAAEGEQGLKVWATADGREVAFARGGIAMTALALSPDGSRAAFAAPGGGIGLWKVGTQEYHALRDAGEDFLPPAASVAFSADGASVVAGLNDGTIKVYDVASGAERLSFGGHAGGVNSVAFHPGGKLLISGGAEGQTRLWNAADGKLLASLIAVGEADHVAVTPDGYYTASKRGARAVSFRFGREVAAFEQYDLRFNRPDVLMERVGLAPPELTATVKKVVERRLERAGLASGGQVAGAVTPPRLALVGLRPPAQTREKVLRLKVRAEAGGDPLGRLRVSVNDVPIHGTAGLPLGVRLPAAEREMEVELQRGRNRIQILAFDEKGSASAPLEYEVTCLKEFVKPDLYLLAVGVSEYKESGRNLTYAAKDADDVVKFFESKAPRFGRQHILRLTNAQATRDAILRAREFLAGAGVDDEVVIFIAGHGVLHGGADYYFAPHDFRFADPAAQGVSYEALEGLLDGLRARNKLVLMDTCHAGEVDKEDARAAAAVTSRPAAAATAANDPAAASPEELRSVRTRDAGSSNDERPGGRLGLNNSFELLGELFNDMRRGSGAQVIAAASGFDVAFELGELRNGVFTHSLLEALNSESADTSGDGKLQVFELRDYVNAKVVALTRGVQRPVMRRENIEFDFNVF